MRIKISKNSIYIFLFFTLFLDAYRLFSIENRDITLWYIGALALFLISFFNANSLIQGLKENIWPLIMIIYMILNYIFMESNALQSLSIGLLFWGFYIASYRKCTVETFEKNILFFQKGMNIFAIYGIYQVIAYKFSLFFADPWIEGVMVDGYNWGNYVEVGSISLRRANAVFREPSFFAQFLAMNMLIYIQNIITFREKGKQGQRRVILHLTINGIALILTFAGTGFLVLIIGTFFLIITNNLRASKIFLKKYKILIFAFVCCFFSFIFIPNPIIKHILSRFGEFDVTNIESISGYLRFVLPYQASFEIIGGKNAFFGLGIGNAIYYTMKNGFLVGPNIQPILPRTISEEGIIGFVIIIMFSIKIWKKNNIKRSYYKSVLIGTYLISFMSGTWSSEVFWLFLGFLNIELKETIM